MLTIRTHPETQTTHQIRIETQIHPIRIEMRNTSNNSRNANTSNYTTGTSAILPIKCNDTNRNNFKHGKYKNNY